MGVQRGMPMYDIAIVDGEAVNSKEEFETIEIARERTIMAAIDLMLQRPSQVTPRIADCAIREIGGEEERSFAVSLGIYDYV